MVEKNEKYKYEILSEDHSAYDFSFKILALGSTGVGKTNLIQTGTSKNKFTDEHFQTVGFEFFTFNIKINDKIIKLQIWDTSGDPLYRSLITNFYRNCSFILYIYSINNKESFQSINEFIKNVNLHVYNSLGFLIGNKKDLINERVISTEEGLNFATQNNLNLFIECSAKNNENVQKIFVETAIFLYEKNMNINNNQKIKILSDGNSDNITPNSLNKTFENIKIGQKNYKVLISLKLNGVNFLIQEQNTLFKKTFEKNLKQNDFQKIHTFFSEFLNVSQIYDKICEFFTDKKIEGHIKDKELILRMDNKYYVPIPIKENNNNNINEKMEYLYTIIKELKEENKELREKFNQQEKKIKRQDEEIKQLKKNIIPSDKEINYDNYFKESSIIINNEERSLLSKWIDEDSEKEIKLLYKSSEDGDLIKTFHEKCDNKGPTILIIKSTNGKKFGGYNPLFWDSSNKFKNTSDSFIFSLDNKKKYIIENEEQKKFSIFGGKNALGFGGGFDICIKDTFMKTNNNYCRPTSFNFKNESELTGEKNFIISELEVYSVDF